MTPLFRPMAHYQGASPPAIDPLAGYTPDAAPPGFWPSDRGCPGQTARSGEPLLTDRFTLLWTADAGAAAPPDQLLVGDDLVVLGGLNAQRMFSHAGAPLGERPRGSGASYLEIAGQRLLADDREGGLYTYLLPEGRADGRVMLSPVSEHTTRQILAGPGLLVFVSARPSPFGPSPDVIVEAVRPRDWGNVSEHGIFYGLQPLAGIIHEERGIAAAAAGRAGPVVALPAGLHWCDWQLRPIAEHRQDWLPLALSADAAGRAHLLAMVGGATHLLIVPSGGPPLVDLELPGEPAGTLPAPAIAPSGQILVGLPGQLIAVDPRGTILWQTPRAGSSPVTVSANGVFLTAGDALVAVTPDGDRTTLWTAPEPLVTAPVLAGDRLYVASATHLFALRAR